MPLCNFSLSFLNHTSPSAYKNSIYSCLASPYSQAMPRPSSIQDAIAILPRILSLCQSWNLITMFFSWPDILLSFLIQHPLLPYCSSYIFFLTLPSACHQVLWKTPYHLPVNSTSMPSSTAIQMTPSSVLLLWRPPITGQRDTYQSSIYYFLLSPNFYLMCSLNIKGTYLKFNKKLQTLLCMYTEEGSWADFLA